MIRAENLSYGFPDKDLYDNISFTLEEGQHCALIGSNGTGKTTLVDILRRPESYLYDGTLELENVGRIGYVSQFASREKEQQTTVFDYLSGDFLRLQSEIAAICEEMETEEDLEPLLERYQVLLDENESMDGDNYETNLRRQLHLADLESKAGLELANLSGGEAIDLMEKGVLIDLKPYITAEKMPNLTALLQQFPDVMDAITLPSVGNIEDADTANGSDGKFLQDGKFVIRKAGKVYNAAGLEIK